MIFGIVILYFIILLGISFLTGKKNAGNEAFFIGNRQSPWYIVAFGMIGTSISGVTFISVPGWVRSTDLTYLQMAFGFFFGYVVIANILLPLYYRLRVTSIYTYLEKRLGKEAYKTGALFFLGSKLLGAAAKLYIVVLVIQRFILDAWNIPFYLTVCIVVLLIFIYTFRSGIRTIIWTDMLQTFFLLAALVLILWQIISRLDINLRETVNIVTTNEHFHIFEFDWKSSRNFFKQFFSGIFITIVMTGLDQDMMQKNLSCKNLKEAQKNMYSYAWTFIPINFLFLCLGILLLIFADAYKYTLPEMSDEILPFFAAGGILGSAVQVFFMIGIMSAAFSSADSALTALTTSYCIDILEIKRKSLKDAEHTRFRIHIGMSFVFIITILLFNVFNNTSVIDAIYILVSYTYGPLLGLFTFGMFTRFRSKGKFIPYICLISPLISFITDKLLITFAGYKCGYEILIFNGFVTFLGLWLFRRSVKQ